MLRLSSCATKTISLNALITAAAFWAATAQAAPSYVASVIEPREEIQDYLLADFDGDGRQDLLLPVWSESAGRELLIYLQDAEGRFPGAPSRRVEVKSDIVAFAVADLREEPGEELLFLTRSAIYSYSTLKDGYADNLQKLTDWDLIATVPTSRTLVSLGRLSDYNNDGHPDLLLPGQGSYGLFYGSADGFAPVQRLPRPHHNSAYASRQASQLRLSLENGLQLVVESPSAFSSLFPSSQELSETERRSLGRYGSAHYIMDVERWLPSVQAVQISDGDRADFVFVDHAVPEKPEDEPRQRLNVVRQNDVSQRAWHGLIPLSGEIFFADLNADGRDDLMILDHQGSNDSRLSLFLNREGTFDFSSADQVLRFSGYEVEVEARDLDGDSRPELIVSYYSLGSVDSLRSGAMQRSTLIYPPAEGDLIFARRPASRVDERFSADGVKGLAERPHFSADVSGNGRKDWLAVDEQGALIAKTIDTNFQVGATPFWRFVPTYLVYSIVPGDFGNGASADFLLVHQNAVTVLVSRDE